MHSAVISATGLMVIDMVSMLVTFVGRPGKFESEGEYCCCTSSARIFASVRIVGSELVRESLLIFERVTLDVAVAVVDSPFSRIGRTCSFQEKNPGAMFSARTQRLSVCLRRLPRRVQGEHLCLIRSKKLFGCNAGKGQRCQKRLAWLVLAGLQLCLSFLAR